MPTVSAKLNIPVPEAITIKSLQVSGRAVVGVAKLWVD